MAKTVTLPYPPSVNNMYATVHGRRVLSREGRAYKAAAAATALAAGMRPTAREVAVTVDLYRPRRSGDIDNSLKAVFDSLTGVAWEDDSQVCEVRARRHDTDKRNPRAVVTVEPITLEDLETE